MTTVDDLKKATNGLNSWKSQFRTSLSNLFRSLGNNPTGFSQALETFSKKVETDIQTIIQPLNTAIDQLALLQTPSGTTTTNAKKEINELIKFADFLDENGAHALADKVTEVAILLKASAEEKSDIPVQSPHEGSLSMRHCPDHCGVSVMRISENIYQCPLDGKIYNYEIGYTNYKGQKIPGGSISEQTPATSDCGGVPLRIFDGTQNVLNRIN
jgi:hypothetical protein